MGQITIRGIHQDVERQIRAVARKRGTSLSRTVVGMIESCVSRNNVQHKRMGESLLSLSGDWDETDENDFRAAIQICEQVDEELWR